MGGVLKRWKGEESSEEILESLQKQLQKLESVQQQDEQRSQRFIGLLMFYSIILYIAAAALFYFYYLPEQWKDKVINSIPLLLFPLLIYGVRKMLKYFFGSRKRKNARKLEELRAKKQKVIENIKEKETYKKAKELLDRFDPDSSLLKSDVKQETSNGKPSISTPGTEVRQRNMSDKNLSTPNTPAYRSFSATPPRHAGTPLRAMSPALQRQFFINNVPPGTPPGPPRPIPVRPKERTIADKFVDYLVGDGPNNRYALICRACHSHNGMALKEDFEYTTFRCCYCYHLNEARKKRPSAPPLEGFSSSVGPKGRSNSALVSESAEDPSGSAPECADGENVEGERTGEWQTNEENDKCATEENKKQ